MCVTVTGRCPTPVSALQRQLSDHGLMENPVALHWAYDVVVQVGKATHLWKT